MDTPVNIYKRNMKCPKNVKYQLELELLRSQVWTMWETRDGGVDVFDEVNQQINTATDILRLHYDPDFRQFKFVEIDNTLYEVLTADFLDKKNKEFIVLYCVMKGSNSKQVNKL